MADPIQILGAFRAHLITVGVVREPGGGPLPSNAPPMFVEPEDGPIVPGEARTPEENDATLILSAFWSGAIAAGDDAYRIRGTIDVRFRAKKTAGLRRSAATAARIRAQMFEPGDPSPGICRQGWIMAGIPVIRTGEWAPYQRIGSSRGDGYDHVWKAYVEFYAT